MARRRGYDRHQDFERAEHVAELLAQRRQARAQQLLPRFLALSPKAVEYYRGLEDRCGNPRHHVQKIVALTRTFHSRVVAQTSQSAVSRVSTLVDCPPWPRIELIGCYFGAFMLP